jgi:hypothetical protein
MKLTTLISLLLLCGCATSGVTVSPTIAVTAAAVSSSPPCKIIFRRVEVEGPLGAGQSHWSFVATDGSHVEVSEDVYYVHPVNTSYCGNWSAAQ